MTNPRFCQACGGKGHTTKRSTKCLFHETRQRKPTTPHRNWVYLCLLLVIAVGVVWLWMQQCKCTANVESPNSYNIEPYNISDIEHAYTSTVVGFDHFEPSMYLFRDASLRASQDIFFVFGFCALLLLFKSYLADLATLKDAVLILANQASE
jgi:hypothetical protein